MKRIWNAVGKTVRDGNFQKKAVNYVEKIEKGSTKVHAPKVPTEEKRFNEAQKDDAVKKDLETRHEGLLGNMNKFKITSVEPPEREVSDKTFPTRESEWYHRNDPVWEFGFYEPEADKIPKNKLTFREALEILEAKGQLNDPEQTPAASKRREIATAALENHAGFARVDQELVDKMYEFFRPFQRKDLQKVVNKHDLAQLQEYLQGRTDDKRLVEGTRDHVRELFKKKLVKEEYDRLDDEEIRKFQEAVLKIREGQHDRLEKRLKDIKTIESKIEEMERKSSEEKKPHE
ncbi:unnamed protein product [Auanema sp. JU1783]|nr:unnamed protein product [Auanema sp. JU1783]